MSLSQWTRSSGHIRLGELTWFAALRKKFKEAAGEVREARSTAKDSLVLKAEVARLDKLFAEAGVEPRKRSPLMSLRMEVIRLCKETIHALHAERGGLRM